MSLKIEKWRFYLTKHFDRYFVKKLLNIIKRNANVEYIEIKKFNVFENHNSIKQTFDILIVDFHKQFVVRRICKLHFSFFVHYICSSLNLISKHDDEWKRIHDFFYSKDNSINENIIENVEIVKYVTFNKIIAIFIFQERNVVMFKKNFVNAFKHILVIILNRWLFDFE